MRVSPHDAVEIHLFTLVNLSIPFCFTFNISCASDSNKITVGWYCCACAISLLCSLLLVPPRWLLYGIPSLLQSFYLVFLPPCFKVLYIYQDVWSWKGIFRSEYKSCHTTPKGGNHSSSQHKWGIGQLSWLTLGKQPGPHLLRKKCESCSVCVPEKNLSKKAFVPKGSQ